MTINARILAIAVNGQRIDEVISAIQPALKIAVDLIAKKSVSQPDFNLIDWMTSKNKSADEKVLTAKMQNAIKALNQPYDIYLVKDEFDGVNSNDNSKCTIATLVSIYAMVPSTRISASNRMRWIGILLDMIIIGCDYSAKNSADNNSTIIDYLTSCELPEAKNILNARQENGKFDNKKLVAIKNPAMKIANLQTERYVSLASVSSSNSHTLFNSAGAQSVPYMQSQPSGQSLFRAVSPGPASPLLNEQSHDHEDGRIISCCLLPLW